MPHWKRSLHSCRAKKKMLANAFHLLFVTGSRLDTYGDISRRDYFVSAETFLIPNFMHCSERRGPELQTLSLAPSVAFQTESSHLVRGPLQEQTSPRFLIFLIYRIIFVINLKNNIHLYVMGSGIKMMRFKCH